LRQLQDKRYRAVSEYWASRRRLLGGPRTTTAVAQESSSPVAAPSVTVRRARVQQPAHAIKPAAVKATKLVRRI